jgi:TIR domain
VNTTPDANPSSRPTASPASPPYAPVLALYGPGDADWAACLMLDLRSRGVDLIDHHRAAAKATQTTDRDAGALVVVWSWFDGGRTPAPAHLVQAVQARNGPYIIARRNSTRLHLDDCPGRTHQFVLWDDYYQPARRRSGRGDGGFGNILNVLLGPGATIDLPDGYVFISYRFHADGPFVHDRLRPVLSRAGLTSWAYHVSPRVPDDKAREDLGDLIRHASMLLVVTTPQWWSPWSDFEVRTARRHGKPVLAVQPQGVRASRRSILAGTPTVTLDMRPKSAATLVAALTAAGARPHGTDAPMS